MKFNEKQLLGLSKIDGGEFSTPELSNAQIFCRSLALGHYENFPVGSVLIPKQLQEHVYSTYAFARVADDISDELTHLDESVRIEALDNLGELLKNCIINNVEIQNPVVLALTHTIKKMKLPVEPYLRLIEAFKMDVSFKQADSIADLENYCSYSANPVGEIILRLHNLYNENTAKHSDQICTGLQLVNFWQDISRDYQNNRIYLPKDIMEQFGLTNEMLRKESLHDEEISIKLKACLEYLFKLTDEYFSAGLQLLKYIDIFRLKLELSVTIQGGLSVHEKAKKLSDKLTHDRPKLNKLDYFGIIFKAISRING